MTSEDLLVGLWLDAVPLLERYRLHAHRLPAARSPRSGQHPWSSLSASTVASCGVVASFAKVSRLDWER